MIEKIEVYKVANGYVVQIKCLGISTSTTFVVDDIESLTDNLPLFINKVLEDKL